MNIVWRKGATTVEGLPGGKCYLFRFHADPSRIPGDLLSSCVVAEVGHLKCEVKAWGGRRGPTTEDMRDIREFCMREGFKHGFWRRYKRDRDPKIVTLFGGEIAQKSSDL